MFKKILKVLIRIVGAFLLLLGTLALVVEVCTCVFLYRDGFLRLRDLVLPLITVLIILIGWRMLLLKKTIYYINKFKEYRRNREQIMYQKEQRRHEEALERADQMTIARNNAIAEGTYEDEYEKKKIKYMKSKKPDYVDKPLTNRKQEICAHFCTATDTVWKVLYVILLLLGKFYFCWWC